MTLFLVESPKAAQTSGDFLQANPIEQTGIERHHPGELELDRHRGEPLLLQCLAQNAPTANLGLHRGFQLRPEARENLQLQKLKVIQLHLPGFLLDSGMLRFAADP